MSDQGIWFKLWCGAEDDPNLGSLSNENFGRWCKIGLYIKKHGTDGTVVIPKPAIPLQTRFKVDTLDDVLCVLEEMPNITVSLETNLTVTMKNWRKFQGDFSSHRVRRFRGQMKRLKRRREERRREETRRDENINPPTPKEIDKIEIPKDLAGSEKEIRDWLEYKRQKGQGYKSKGIDALWQTLRRMPFDLRAASIQRSMANNWAGIFPDRTAPPPIKEIIGATSNTHYPKTKIRGEKSE